VKLALLLKLRRVQALLTDAYIVPPWDSSKKKQRLALASSGSGKALPLAP
jgi:hypothetical protein